MKGEGNMPFNMAALYYLELHHLREAKVKALIEKNNIFAYYECLEEIFIMVNFRLSDDEKKEIKDQFKDALDSLETNVGGSVGKHIQFFVVLQAKTILKEIDERLINLMYKYHMLFPKVQMFDLAVVNKRYGLEEDEKGDN